jgi:hypothetical protein
LTPILPTGKQTISEVAPNKLTQKIGYTHDSTVGDVAAVARRLNIFRKNVIREGEKCTLNGINFSNVFLRWCILY